MKIAIVGPTHPYKGGIAQHTTELAHQLTKAGHEATIISWKNQYPFFYPGEQFVPEGKPELPVFDGTKRVLSWRNPAGWVRWARKLRNFDQIIFVWYVPTIQGPVYFSILKALGKRSKAKKIILCHNVIQHSPGPADKQIVQQVFKLADEILVHNEPQRKLAEQYTKTPIVMSGLPPHYVGTPKELTGKESLRYQLLFFGLVRKYKGIDVLLKALAQVPDVKLVVAGEMWGKQQEALDMQIRELQLGDRVELRPGYVADEAVSDLFANADALVLPYRSGTGSWNAKLGFYHHRPVIATTIGSFSETVRNGIDGLLCEPDDPESLAAALKRFYEPSVAAHLQAQVPNVSAQPDWDAYVQTLTGSQT